MPDSIDKIRDDAVSKSPDAKTRTLLLIFALVAVGSLLVAIVAGYIAWRNAADEALEGKQIAEQLRRICAEDKRVEFQNRNLCEQAEEVTEGGDDPEIQDSEIDDPDPNDPEIQDPENQEAEIQDPENQQDERQDAENQDAEEQEAEQQDGDPNDPDPTDDPDPNDPDPTDDPDPDDPENQDPEVDDPDPASPYQFEFTFTVPGNGVGQSDHTYHVVCNSGTGNCTVTEQ